MVAPTSFLRHWLPRLTAFCLLVVLACLQMRIALQEQLEYSGDSNFSALFEYLRSPFLLTWQGKRLHMLQGDVAQAEEAYKRALEHSSLYIPAWLGLAELYNDQGKKTRSREILAKVDELTASIHRWRWEKAMLNYQLGRHEVLAQDLSWIIEKIPGESRQKALKLAFSLWSSPDELLKNIGEKNVLHLFNYASQIKKINIATAYWPHIEERGVDAHRQEVLTYLNSLIADGEMAVAIPIWKMYFNHESLLYNGNFVAEPANLAFDWRIGKPKGSTFRIETFGGKEHFRALRLHFSGTENIAYSHLSQIVPLAPGKHYRLRGKAKTSMLTSDQQPFLEVTGYKCSLPQAKTEMLLKDQPWTDLTLTFNVPDDCQAVLLRLRREPSSRLDNLLAGDLWLRDLAIDEIAPDISLPGPKI